MTPKQQETDDLIARLEKATGPDARLDAAIALRVGVYKLSRTRTSILDMREGEKGHYAVGTSTAKPYSDEEAEESLARLLGAPAYTASIDAALTLFDRPFAEHVELIIKIDNDYCTARLQKRGLYEGEEENIAVGDSKKPACAVAACALRSRAMTDEGETR